MVTKEAIFISAFMFVLVLACIAHAGVSVVFNDSFEYDRRVIDPITQTDTPEHWDDISNLPSNQFGAALWKGWPTTDDYSLVLHSYRYEPVDEGDKAIVSQDVYLTDTRAEVNEISFEIIMSTTPDSKSWDPSKRSVVLLIDGQVVWESNSVGSDVRGEYFETYTLDAGYKDANSHKLSLGIIAKEDEAFPLVKYTVRWDFVSFDTHCQNYGYMLGDIDLDCDIDWDDLQMMAGQWLGEPPADKYDLFQDDGYIVDLYDFAILIDGWLGDSFGMEDRLLVVDLNNDGIVNLIDFAILTELWSTTGVDYDDIFEMTDQWLLTNWLYWVTEMEL